MVHSSFSNPHIHGGPERQLLAVNGTLSLKLETSQRLSHSLLSTEVLEVRNPGDGGGGETLTQDTALCQALPHPRPYQD